MFFNLSTRVSNFNVKDIFLQPLQTNYQIIINYQIFLNISVFEKIRNFDI